MYEANTWLSETCPLVVKCVSSLKVTYVLGMGHLIQCGRGHQSSEVLTFIQVSILKISDNLPSFHGIFYS